MPIGEIKKLVFADGVTVSGAVTATNFSRSVSFSMNGSDLTKSIDVSSITSAAENYIWILKNPSGKQIMADLTGSGGNVSLSTDPIALAAGTYTIFGV